MKNLIVCIVGPSGSGKTTASMFLQNQLGWNTIVSYTTRKMRPGEIDGVDHWFVNSQQVPTRSDMCAYTKFGGYEYWTVLDQFSLDQPNVYVIDEKGLHDLLKNEKITSKFSICSIKVRRENLESVCKERRERDKGRFHISDDWYDYVIDNNGSLEQFQSDLILTARNIIKKQ